MSFWKDFRDDYYRGMNKFMDVTGLRPYIERLAGWLSKKLEGK